MGDPNLVISGGGSTIIATDAMLADADALADVHWILNAVEADLKIAAAMLDGTVVTVAVHDELAGARYYADAACERSAFLRDKLRMAMAAYSVGEATAEWLATEASALLAFFAGASLRFWTFGGFSPSAVAAALTLPWLVRAMAEGQSVGPNDVSMPPELTAALADPVVIGALRRAVSSGDEAALGFGGTPAMLEIALAAVGVTGVSSTALLLGAYGSYAGLLVETPVKVQQTDTREAAATTGFEARVDKIPQTGEPGAPQIRIDRVEGAGVEPRFEVYIGGTADFSPIAGTDAFDFTSNIAGVAGLPAGSMRAVHEALAMAGVTATSEVTFTGHSQGGLVAAALAASGDYNTRGVVTIGAPAGHIVLPEGMPVVIIENREDFVPALGGVQTNRSALLVTYNAFPDDQPVPEVVAAGHRIEAYEAAAAALDNADSSRVRQFASELDQFSSGATRVVSTYYYASRVNN